MDYEPLVRNFGRKERGGEDVDLCVYVRTYSVPGVEDCRVRDRPFIEAPHSILIHVLR